VPDTPKLLSALLFFGLAVSAEPVTAEPLQVTGTAGFLGEWALSATVDGAATSGRIRQYSGPLTLRHTGLCTHDGADEQTGQMQLQISASRVDATFTLAGVPCSFRGRLTDAGTMTCANQEPIPLKLFVK
jgi:hypothetical protein